MSENKKWPDEINFATKDEEGFDTSYNSLSLDQLAASDDENEVVYVRKDKVNQPALCEWRQNTHRPIFKTACGRVNIGHPGHDKPFCAFCGHLINMSQYVPNDTAEQIDKNKTV
ncbi:hypothetical protein AAKU67_002247 [Oxalobacteraceae bacterium GrIS 2.11]